MSGTWASGAVSNGGKTRAGSGAGLWTATGGARISPLGAFSFLGRKKNSIGGTDGHCSRSTTGFVNVYSADSTLSLDTPKPTPLKTLGNLITNISCLRYNHDAQLLAMASNVKKDQMRLVCAFSPQVAIVSRD